MHPTIAKHLAGMAEICRRYDVARLDVFGSAARSEDFNPEISDADFLVDFNPTSTLPPLRQYFGLSADLETLLGRPVDLIQSRAIKNPFILAEINRSREAVYAP